jgi:hypothetical protein
MINKYSHPTLAWILDYWPATVLLPAVLILIAGLALVTRWWDERDRVAAEERAEAAGTSSSRRPAEAGVPAP